MSSAHPSPAGRFETTRWSVVVAARDRPAPEAREALADLCRAYWYPLYAFVRRQGFASDEAQDLTQEFFARLLEKDFLRAVDRDRGKFRSFLLAACRHFLANERDRARAQKRGGGREVLSIELDTAEGKYVLEPSHTLTPEKLFERRWALTLLDQALARLRADYESQGKGRVFDGLKRFLTGEKTGEGYSSVAAELGMSEGAVKVAVHRLRGRYREVLREEVARTLDEPGDVDAEIGELFNALGS